MACCGGARHRGNQTATTDSRTNTMIVEYRGQRPMTLFGRVTGLRYYFPGPGARVRVDSRDAGVLGVIRELEVVVEPATH